MVFEGVRAQLLLVEDHEDAAELLVAALDARGFCVTAVNSSAAAATLLEARAFDIVLTDLMVGTHDMVEAWRRVDALRQAVQPMPIGLLSGYQFEPAEVARRRLAFALVKPCATSDLLEQLSIALRLPSITTDQDALARSYLRELEGGDYEALGALCTADVIYNLPLAPSPMPHLVVGRAAFCEFARNTFQQFMRPSFEVLNVRSLPSGALVRYQGSWTDEAGVRKTLPGAIILRFAGDKIQEIGVRTDLSEIS